MTEHKKHYYPEPVRYDITEWQRQTDSGEWVEARGEVEARTLASYTDDRMIRHRPVVDEFTHHRDPGTVVETGEWVTEQEPTKRTRTVQWWVQADKNLYPSGFMPMAYPEAEEEKARVMAEKFGRGLVRVTTEQKIEYVANKNSDTTEESAT